MKNSEYAYPIDYEMYTTDEIIQLINFFGLIELGYEKGINRKKLLKSYNIFKGIVNSISEEKRIDREFKKLSKYSIYSLIQKAKSQDNDIIKM